LFKGGTSLSKSFGLIDRFSEDIDITVFRNDLGAAASVEELEALSGKKRRAKLDAIKAACQAFIAGPLLANLATLAADTMTAALGPHHRAIAVGHAVPDREAIPQLRVQRDLSPASILRRACPRAPQHPYLRVNAVYSEFRGLPRQFGGPRMHGFPL
jgi:hypothetical protein